MHSGKKILVTICARGGSKGVKSKNIRPLGGRPLIVHSLELLKQCPWIDGYVVSTDSEEIIQTVIDHGFEVRFRRPAELATDKVGRVDAIKHAADWMEKDQGQRYDLIADLGVATPLKNAEDLEGCVKLMIAENAANVFTATEPDRNPYYNMVEVANGIVKVVKELPAKLNDRRDAPQVYSMNDGINVWTREALFTDLPYFNPGTRIYSMPRERSIDIDTEFDFRIAECMVRVAARADSETTTQEPGPHAR